MGVVYYKYKSAKETYSVPLPYSFISVSELKQLILTSNRHGNGRTRGRGPREDIALSNAQTGEEYADENAMIPQNVTVLVRRTAGQASENIVLFSSRKVIEDGSIASNRSVVTESVSKSCSSAEVQDEDAAIAAVIEQTERRAKEKKSLEKQVHDLQEAKKKDDAVIAKLQSDLEKLSELRTQEKKTFDSELEKSQQSLLHAENYCADKIDFFSEKLSVYAVNPEAERTRMDEFGEIMRRDDYAPRTVQLAQSLGLLTMRITQASKFANEVMGATLTLKNNILPNEDNRVSLASVVPFLQAAPQHIVRWKRSSARSGANYALALTKAHFSDRVHNLERVGGGEPEHGPSCTTYLTRYAETASRVALLPDLNFFVESTGVESESDEAAEE